MNVIIAALLTHPECQKKAQEEIDHIVGHDRLPTFEDRENLPYVQCLIYECQRWQPVAPLGKNALDICIAATHSVSSFTAIPHRVMEDDVYNGMFIPKGSTILLNARCDDSPSLYVFYLLIYVKSHFFGRERLQESA